MAFDDLDDLDVNFDAADIEGKLLALVKTAVVKRKTNDDGLTSTGVSVTYEIENDETFEGQSITQYYWLGSKDASGAMVKRPNAGNIKSFKSVVAATTGTEPEGTIKLSEYGPVKRTIRNNEETCLENLEGSHVMITVIVRKDNDGVERSIVQAVSPYHGTFDSDEEQF